MLLVDSTYQNEFSRPPHYTAMSSCHEMHNLRSMVTLYSQYV